MRMIVRTAMAALAFLFPTASVHAAQSEACEALTGAAHGLCRAAVALGCDGSESQRPSCTPIQETYAEVTGTSPPWVKCPCGTGE